MTVQSATSAAEPVPWWASFFADDLYLESDLDLLDPHLTAQMVDAVAALVPTGRLLDLACGPGRHSVPLSARGYDVTGVDISDEYLARARRRAASAGQSASFAKADMRDLSAFPDGSFDAVVSLHTSVGFFDSAEQNSRVFAEAARVLRPGGRLLVDVVNRDWLLQQVGEAFAVAGGECVKRTYDDSRPTVYLHEERFDPVSSRVRWTVKEIGGRGRSSAADYRVYSVHEIVELCTRHGLLVEALHGGYDLRPFTALAEHIVCLAIRRDG
jgi:ubiquinone/menaquinone biosynthesis C-methylase UbiE